MVLDTYTNKIRPPVMQVFILNKPTPETHLIDIDALIEDSGAGPSVGITVGLESAVKHLYDLDVDAAFVTGEGYKFDNKRLKSIKLPKQGTPSTKDPYLGYDDEGMQQYDLIVSDDPETMISFNVKLDGSEHELIYPSASQSGAEAGTFGAIAKRAGLRVGQDLIKTDVLILMDGTVGNSNGKRIAHYFENVNLMFTPDEGSADNKADLKGTFEGTSERYWIEKEQ